MFRLRHVRQGKDPAGADAYGELPHGLSKTLPPETVEIMRKAIATLDRNGELKRILEKWSYY